MNVLATAPPNKDSTCTDCSRNGILAVSCGNIVLLINVQQCAVLGELRGHRKRVHCVRFHKSLAIEHLLATASIDGAVKVWDTDLKREIRSIQYTRAIISCFFSSLYPHILLILSEDSKLCGWDLTSKNKDESLKLLHNGDNSIKGKVTSVEISSSDLLLLGLSSGLILGWNVFESPYVEKSFQQHTHPVHSITSCCGKYESKAKQSEYFYSICEDGLVCGWNTNDSTPCFMISIKEKVSSFSKSSKAHIDRFILKYISPDRMAVAIGYLRKPFLLEIPSLESTCLVSYEEISGLHRNSITSLLVVEYQKRLWIISIAIDGCIGLWDADSAAFHHWILKGSNGYPLSFSIAKDYQYPLVISYSNGSIGFVDSRECLNIRQQPNIQTTKRLSFLSRDDFVCDICYVPCSSNFSPNFLSMVTTRGQLFFGRIHFSSPNESEDSVLENLYLQKICSTYLGSKITKSGNISNKFRLCWIMAYNKEDENIFHDENILHLLMTNQLMVIESDPSEGRLEASLWYLKMNSAKELIWQFRTCLSQELKTLSIQRKYLSDPVNIHSIQCSPNGRYIGIACNFQHCFIWDVNTMNLVSYMEIAKLHLLSQWQCISQVADNQLTDKIPLAFSCIDGRVGLLCFDTSSKVIHDTTNHPLDIIWCEISFQKPIVSLCTIQDTTIQVAIALSDGSIQIWLPMKEKTPSKLLPGQRELISKLEWNGLCTSFIVSIGSDKMLRLWDITRWS
ncbi:hypothetical protein GpartN1_g4851.t1 [Galdieria partita]|uniref:Uncharacterized protein n=1 Tax=Galdieria partita TaxID=83374 RepID=A0A9C7URU1_9RHOD|nr:hypothetical protein GpartN1_g4851.t1 [Galdieria partita]